MNMTAALPKKVTIPLVCVIVLFGLYWLILALSHAGKVPVSIQVVPRDSIVYANSEQIRDGTVYLKPGNYTFTAKASGFSDDKTELVIKGKSEVVYLLPVPNSQEAIDYLKNHKDISDAREAIGSQKEASKGLAKINKTPIISLLPVVNVQDLYAIDYGPSETRKDGTFLLINDSSPAGRVNALKWIRQQGYDPTDLEIRFDDFVNPIFNYTDSGL